MRSAGQVKELVNRLISDWEVFGESHRVSLQATVPLLHWLYSSLVTMRTRSLKAVIMVHPAASLGEICSVRVADSPLAERRILCGHDTRDDRKRPGKGLPVVRVRVEGRAFEGAEVASVLVNLSGAGS